LDGHTTLGARNKIYSFAAIGIPPQDYTYKGEPTRVVLGDDNQIFQSVTISRGTLKGGGVTRLGNSNFLMTLTHIGHDSQIGNGCLFANGATLAGHVTVEDYATVGALCALHQFCTIGKYSYLGAATIVTQDVLPYSLTSAVREGHAYNINKVGLMRRGFTAEQLKTLARAFRFLLAGKRNTSQALELMREIEGEEVQYLVKFIERAERGIIK
jgi:UDP-N-acetylglucosamine acyltransferase